MSEGRHSERVVLITGAASGIGAAITDRYCREGASVALLDVNADSVRENSDALNARGYRTAWAQADVADYKQCAKACQALEAALGPIDTLINNAGVSPKHNGVAAPIWQMEPDEWQKVVGINLNGVFNLTRLLSPGMVERRFGRIVNMSSVAGKAYLPLVASHYSATKAALIGFTRHVAGELGPYGVRVNALAPGRIETPLVKSVADEINQDAISNTALRRLGTPDEVARVACFLTSSDSDFVTGQVVDVAGGWMMT